MTDPTRTMLDREANPADGAAAPEEVPPFSRLELRAMLRAPLRVADLLLVERRRFAVNVVQDHRLPTMALVLLAATVAFAVPFGVVLGAASAWRVAALLAGGLAVCFPSLQVFGLYLGS